MPDGSLRPALVVRRCEPRDHAIAARLLYESSGGMYDRYAGSRPLAEAVLRAALASDGTTASADVVHLAELDGGVAGAVAAMPFSYWVPRAQRFLRVSLTALPWRRWPTALRIYRATGRSAPDPPPRSLYVDSLAVASDRRRRGVATALLARAEQLAREHGLRAISLDTWADNEAARALYRSAGFVEVAHAPPRRGLPGGVALRKQL